MFKKPFLGDQSPTSYRYGDKVVSKIYYGEHLVWGDS